MVTLIAMHDVWHRMAPAAGLRRAGQALWHGLERHGRLHASRELQTLAEACEASDPARARRLREAIAYMVIP